MQGTARAAEAASHGMQGMPRHSFAHSTYDEVNSTLVHTRPPHPHQPLIPAGLRPEDLV